MKELKIEIPEGYEIDRENSTFEKIVFKEKDKLPTSITEVEVEDDKTYFFINRNSKVVPFRPLEVIGKLRLEERNTFREKEDAEAVLALIELIHLRDIYNGEPIRNWVKYGQLKHVIVFENNKISKLRASSTIHVLSFKTEEIRDKFYENNLELIEKAKWVI